MADIIVKMKDGTAREFRHEGRPGGSYTKSVRLEAGFVVVEDEWGKRPIIPAQDVAEVVERPHRGW